MTSDVSAQELAKLLEPAWNWLGVVDEPAPADVIFVLGGNGDIRAHQAARLWREHWAPVVLVSGSAGSESYDQSINEAEFYAGLLIKLGVDEDRIVLEPHATNTAENIAFGMARLQELDLDSQRVLLVGRICFMRRALATFQQQFPDGQLISSPHPEALLDYLIEPHRTPEQRAERLCAEVDRIAGYPGRGFMVPVAIPDEVRHSVARTRAALA